MTRQSWLSLSSLIAGGYLGFCSFTPALAQSEILTRAEVYRIRNRVQLIPSNQPARPARVSDVLVPSDAIRTASRSRVELLFNEGSLARIGSSAIFRFVPGTRRYQLPNGTIRAETIFELTNGLALLMTSPGSVATQTRTPQSRIEIFSGETDATSTLISSTELSQTPPPPPPTESASAVLILHEQASNTTQVFALTNSSIRVSNPNSGEFTRLDAGQTLAVINNEISAVRNFDLERFYQTSELALGLGPGQENLLEQELPAVQQILNQVRDATLGALSALRRETRSEDEGLCIASLRGASAFPSHNCITNDSDEPLRRFQDKRDVVRPAQVTEPPPLPPPPPPPPPTPPPPTPPPPTPPPPPPPPPPTPIPQ